MQNLTIRRLSSKARRALEQRFRRSEQPQPSQPPQQPPVPTARQGLTQAQLLTLMQKQVALVSAARKQKAEQPVTMGSLLGMTPPQQVLDQTEPSPPTPEQ